MNSRTARLLCPLVFMGMVGCSDAEMRKFVWTLRMIVFGAGGICGAITGLVVSLMHNKSNPQRIRSIPLSIVTGGHHAAYPSRCARGRTPESGDRH